jgi:hypothetical protein
VACLSWQGCLSDSSNAIILNSVNNYNFTNKSITIYPNPNDGNFNIKSSINGFIEIWHSNGQQIIRRELESSKSTRLNLNLSSGVYLIRLFDESGMVIETSTISVSK